jgi:hypothetical protein
VDARGHLAAHGLRRPVTLRLRLARHTSALDLSRAFVVFNGALPRGLTTRSAATPYSVLAPSAATAAPVSAGALALGRYGTQAATLGAGRLTVVAQAGTTSTSATWNTDAPVALFGSPDPFNVTLNAGALTTSIPITVPAGPGGLTPRWR